MQHILKHSANGNKSTPAVLRKAQTDSIFLQKNLAAQVLKASEKNFNVSSSCIESQDDSESSSDFENEFDYEHISEISQDTPKSQAAIPSKLVIKARNQDIRDDSPSTEHLSMRKPLSKKLFKTKVNASAPALNV